MLTSKSNKFFKKPGSIPKRTKTQLKRITMTPRFKKNTSIHAYNFPDLFLFTRSKENKSSINKGLGGKNGNKIYCFFVVLCYNDNLDGFQRVIAASEKHFHRFLINMPGTSFIKIYYKNISI